MNFFSPTLLPLLIPLFFAFIFSLFASSNATTPVSTTLVSTTPDIAEIPTPTPTSPTPVSTTLSDFLQHKDLRKQEIDTITAFISDTIVSQANEAQRLTKELIDFQETSKRVIQGKLDTINTIVNHLLPVADKLKELYPELLEKINKITQSLKE